MQNFFKHISKQHFITFVACLVLTGALGVSAYVAPKTGPTNDNTRGPIDISTEDQIKDGGLGVFTFHSRGDARLEQNAILKGTVRGGTPADTTSTVTSASDTDVTGLLYAKEFLNSVAISHPGDTEARPLCSDKTGTIGLCTAISTEPILAQVSMVPNYKQSAPYTTQVFWIGPVIPPGSQYILSLGDSFIINAVPGDTPNNLALKMVTSINSKTEAQWREYWDAGGTPPATGTPGFPPRATMVGDSSFKVTAYPGHSFAGYATALYPNPGYCGDMVDGKLIECTKGNPVQAQIGVDLTEMHYCNNYVGTYYAKPPGWGINEGTELYSDQYLQSPQGGDYIREYPGSAIHSMSGNVIGPIVDYYTCF